MNGTDRINSRNPGNHNACCGLRSGNPNHISIRGANSGCRSARHAVFLCSNGEVPMPGTRTLARFTWNRLIEAEEGASRGRIQRIAPRPRRHIWMCCTGSGSRDARVAGWY